MRQLKIENPRAEVIRPEIQRAMLGRDDLGDIMLVLAHHLPQGMWIYHGGAHLAIHPRKPTRNRSFAGDRLAIIY